MLIKPVQRITKYPLLFEDLLACTRPSHPDYHYIQKAAEGARALALEIDEAKRRKDVISSVMSKSQSSVHLVKDPKAGPGGRLLNLRRFKKDKLNGGDGPPDVTPYAQAQLKELVAKLQNSDKCVRLLHRDVAEWVSSNKLLLLNGRDTNLDMLRWYTLEGRLMNDVRAAKVAAYKVVLDTCINTIWQEMHDKVHSSVLATLAKLVDAARNPLAIIDRLNRKSADYARYMAHRHAKKSIDRVMMQEAIDYVAIHTQLLEELPVFLQGYQKIFEVAHSTLTIAQARYYGNMRDITRAFTKQFLSQPTESRLTDAGEIHEVPIDIATARGIHKAWLDRFLAPNNIAKGLSITSADSRECSGLGLGVCVLTRSAVNDGTGESRRDASSRSTSRSDMRSPNPRHTPSVVTRPKSRTESRHTESRNGQRSESRTEQLRSESRTGHLSDSGDDRANRRRSRSLSGQSTGVSDSESSSRFASLMRRNSHRSSLAKQRSRRSLRPPMPDNFGPDRAAERKNGEHTLSVATSEDRLSQHTQQSLDSTSATSKASQASQDVPASMSPQSHVSALEQAMMADPTAEEIASRMSFGLPRIHTESTPLLFGDFGALSKVAPAKAAPASAPGFRMTAGVMHESPVELTPVDAQPTAGSSPRSSVSGGGVVRVGASPPDASLPPADSYPNPNANSNANSNADPHANSNADAHADASADPWSGSGISYACVAVAPFDPRELGDARFLGLRFLPLGVGQEVEVRHEIGRVASLPGFPYAQLGVENDGAVVCRASDGSYGVAMCSFLEPLDLSQANL